MTIPAARRVMAWLWLGVCPAIVVCWMVIYSTRQGTFAVDFHNEIYPETKEILAGRNPFPSPSDPIGAQNAIWPPAVAIVVAPLTLLSPAIADGLIVIGGYVAFLAALWIVGVRDWRVYGAATLWPSVITDMSLAHFSLYLALLVAIAWRTRNRVGAPGVAIGVALAIKLLFVPLVAWLACRKRYVDAALAAAIASAATLLLLPFTSIASYARVLRNLAETFDQDSYSLLGLLLQLGVSGAVAKTVAVAAAAVVAITAWHLRSFALFVATIFLCSPLVWLDYYALMAVPLAIVRPRLSWVWLLPLFTYGMTPAGLDVGVARNTAIVLCVFGVLTAMVVRDERRVRVDALATTIAITGSTDARVRTV